MNDEKLKKPSRIRRLGGVFGQLGLMLKVSLYLLPNFVLLWLAGPKLLALLPDPYSGYVFWALALYLFVGSKFALARADTRSVRDDPFSIDTLITLTIAMWLWPLLHRNPQSPRD